MNANWLTRRRAANISNSVNMHNTSVPVTITSYSEYF